ncbi:MAG TPA: FG-GAP-like repeat-containing protein [Thermoanaerobaculia bacterium]|nr:FG-GAP-like repeat-containing protein [Thermoanaerobaculia bacterium]
MILLLLLPLLAAARGGVAPAESREEAIWQHRNLGKAFYENPTTQQQAVAELAKALALAPESARERLNYGLALLKAGKTAEGIAELERVQKQAPALPHTWFNLGIAWKRASEYDKATAQLERMAELAPEEPITLYNLGALYKLAGKGEASLAQFEAAARLAPQLAGPHFQLYNAYKQAGRADDAARELAIFQEIKKRQAGAAVPEDLEWSFYAEIYDPAEERLPGNPAAAAEAAAAAVPITFADRELARGLQTLQTDGAGAGVLALDVDGDGRAAVLAWSAAGVWLWRPGAAAAVPAPGLEALRGVVAVAAGDFNNDGLPDLCLLTETGARLYVNRGGRFEESPARLPAGRYRKAVWLDYDHDYDLDLILLGDHSALLRNDGAAGWSDRTADFPFAAGRALDAAVLDLVADSPGLDLVVSYEDHPGVIYRDRLAGHFSAEPLPALPAGARSLIAEDLDNDGWTDLAAVAPAALAALAANTAPAGAAPPAAPLVLLRNRQGQLERWTAGGPAPAAGEGLAPGEGPVAIAVADLANRGAADLVAVGARGAVYRLEGGRLAPAAALPALAGLRAVAAADFDGDGRQDLAVVRADGSLHLLRNTTATANRWLAVRLVGVRNPKLAAGARVEVKAGSSYQKRLYRGTPLVFGMRGRERADTVRITWPNGLIQNETRQAAAQAYLFKEAQRLSGSCPMVFTWNGRRFEFITDVLGVAPLGASSGDGTFFPVDHNEWIAIPGEALLPSAGRYEVRITEELHEVTYLDQVRLLALDHPDGLEVYTNEKFKSPPFPEFRLYGVERRIYPRRAVDDQGRDVLPALLRRDGVYPDGFRRTPVGVAELHALELDFPPPAAPPPRTGGARAAADGAVLYLTGWVDWADGSTFRAASQESAAGLQLPRLEVKDAAGRWRTAVEDMGIPAGKPKTIAVDLTGKFLSESRAVRIVTNLCVYWDEIFLGERGAPPEARLTEAPLRSAELRFRGFSQPVVDPERRQPEAFDYQQWMAVSAWNPTPGMYTRYGDVRPLLAAVDDRLVILGSGDELRLRFAAAGLPALPAGWRRDFLLDVDGWAKDGDANTAFGQSVEPLPFHAMSQYPYPAAEKFPDDAGHRLYREHYNRRPALRLVRSLAPEPQKETKR